jgi:hypothetical protein
MDVVFSSYIRPTERIARVSSASWGVSVSEVATGSRREILSQLCNDLVGAAAQHGDESARHHVASSRSIGSAILRAQSAISSEAWQFLHGPFAQLTCSSMMSAIPCQTPS